MEIFSELIGGQILEMNDGGFVVRLKNGQIRTFIFMEDGGGCSGYNILNTELFYSKNSKDNPVITKIDYNRDDDNGEDKLTITFFGVYAPLAIIESLSSSNSGWSYGASMSIFCKETKEEELLTSW